jgi:hypothetical protein
VAPGNESSDGVGDDEAIACTSTLVAIIGHGQTNAVSQKLIDRSPSISNNEFRESFQFKNISTSALN